MKYSIYVYLCLRRKTLHRAEKCLECVSMWIANLLNASESRVPGSMAVWFTVLAAR